MQGDWGSRVALAISWNDSKKEKKGKVLALFVASAISLAVMSPAMRTSMSAGMHEMVSVIVRALPGGETAAAEAVEQAGGEIGRELGIIGGFEARVPEAALSDLKRSPFVYEVTPNGKVQFLQLPDVGELVTDTTDDLLPSLGTDGSSGSGSSGSGSSGSGTSGSGTETLNSMQQANQLPGSMFRTAKTIGADGYYNNGYEGQGVDVALIDTGLVPVQGLPADRVINGPDLSFESQFPETQYLDTMGHGTHMAGIIAADDVPGKFNDNHFQGIAPRSRIVSIKVGQADGASDVSQVIAAIDWVVQHRYDAGMNIRVLSLSFGTDGTQDYMLDPLTFAVENAWHQGIVVVVAGGNSGFGTPKLNNPAYDPYVIAVGAADTKGTKDVGDDVVPEWSSRGSEDRHPDFVAPGASAVSLRAEGSLIDEGYPTARVGDRFFKGSGTSQSAAVVSGAAALLLSRKPELNPDQVKSYLIRTARSLPGADAVAQGAGLVNLDRYKATFPTAAEAQQNHPRATGVGSLELARGTGHVVEEDGNDDGIADDPVELTGEIDIFGMPFDSQTWSALAAAGVSWSGGSWNGTEWTGADWSGTSWSGKSWSGKSWSGKSWSGKSWSGKSWSGKSWSGKSWSGKSWSGNSWS